MKSLKDVLLDIDKYDEDNMIYVKPLHFYTNSRDVGIYYEEEIKPVSEEKKPKLMRKKLIIQSPKMIMPFGVKEFDNENGKKTYKLSLSFNTMTNLYNEEEIKKFFSFVNRIDTVNEETMNDNRKKWGLNKKLSYVKSINRTSKDYPYYMNVNLPYDEDNGFMFNIYDEKSSKSAINILKKKNIISVILEISDIRFNDDNFRTRWTVLQIRKFKPSSPIQDFFMSGCFIFDVDDPEDEAYLSIIDRYNKNLEMAKSLPILPTMHRNDNSSFNIPPPPPPPFTPKDINSSKNNTESNTPSFKPPSLGELSDAIKNLKKSKTIEKKLEGGKVIETKNSEESGKGGKEKIIETKNSEESGNTKKKKKTVKKKSSKK